MRQGLIPSLELSLNYRWTVFACCFALGLLTLAGATVGIWAEGESSNTGGGYNHPTTNSSPKKTTSSSSQPPKSSPPSNTNSGGNGSEEEAVGEDSENGARWGSLPRPEVLERPAVFRRQ